MWPHVALDELCEINVGRTPARANSEYWGEGESWLSIADMRQGREINWTKEKITALGASGGRRTAPGTVLLSFKLSIGKVSRAGIPLYTNEAIAALPIRRPDLITEEYLCRALERADLSGDSNRAAMGATLNKAMLKRIQILVPPLNEQRRIAAILDHADALRAMRRQVLTHLDSLPQSIFHDMFGDPDEANETVPFGEVTALAGGRSLVADDSAAHSEYRVLKISAVTTGQFKPGESKSLPTGYVPPTGHLVRSGDLLMSRANTTELVGAVAYVVATPPNLALPDKVWRFEWKVDAQPIYWHALLSTPTIRRRISRLSSGTGGSMKNIAKAKLETMPVPRISVGRQREFAVRAAKVSQRGANMRRLRNLEDELFASLQARAFRGEL